MSFLGNSMQRVKLSIDYFGFDLTLLGLFFMITNCLGKSEKINKWHKAVCSHRMDNRLNVNTAGVITPDALDFSNIRKHQAVQYQPTASVTFGLVLKQLKINYKQYTFIDYGSGKGRALFLAAQFPFKCIIGVELSCELHRTCQNNIRSVYTHRLQCQSIKSVCEDATTFSLPGEPSVIYFFQPFNKDIFSIVLDNIQQSLEYCPRHIIILYYHPGLENHIGKPAFLRKVDFNIKTTGWNFYENV